MQDTRTVPAALVDNHRLLGKEGCFLFFALYRMQTAPGEPFTATLRELATISTQSIPTIRRLLPALADAKCIEVERGLSSREASTYRIAIPRGEPETETAVKPEPKAVEQGVIFSIEPDADAKFEAWYAIYPRHESRVQARKAFGKALERATYDELLDGARRYAKAKKGERAKHMKLPATWLNNDCWTDVYAEGPAERARATERSSDYYD